VVSSRDTTLSSGPNQPFEVDCQNAELSEPKQAVDESVDTIRYPTATGSLTFEAVCEGTRRYAAYIFFHRYHLHPSSVDEALQAGYSRLWERLHTNPDYLTHKDVPGIGQQVVFEGLHAFRPEQRYQRQVTAFTSKEKPSTSRPHSVESRQTDLRLDVQQAIKEVAERILKEGCGKGRDYDLWALYGLTMLQTTAQETSALFGVRKQSMQKAFGRVKMMLKEALPNYAPPEETRPVRQRGCPALPRDDITAIRKSNQGVSREVYEQVRTQIGDLDADTRLQDEIALSGIESGVSVLAQAKAHRMDVSRMHRAYHRVHRMIAALHDPSVRTLRPEKRQQFIFTLTPETERAVHDLALELMKQPRSFEKLVALHSHISNLPISRTAQYFHIPAATLRYYVLQIGERLQTPRQPAGKDRRGFVSQAVLFEASAAD
jgi:hypothetical protein